MYAQHSKINSTLPDILLGLAMKEYLHHFSEEKQVEKIVDGLLIAQSWELLITLNSNHFAGVYPNCVYGLTCAHYGTRLSLREGRERVCPNTMSMLPGYLHRNQKEKGPKDLSL